MSDKFDPGTVTPPAVVIPSDRQAGGSGGGPGSGLGGGRRSPAEPGQPAHSAPAYDDIVDVASVLGMPADSIPPHIQDALTTLADAVDRLREELELARQHESYLVGEAERHCLLPVLNRRAFMGGLNRLLDTAQRARVATTLVYLQVDGVEALRAKEGLAAGDAALLAIAQTIRRELRQTDLVGYLDGGDFAIALALTEGGPAHDKARALASRLSAPVFEWQGRPYRFTARVGLSVYEPGRTGEDMLSMADADRRGVIAP